MIYDPSLHPTEGARFLFELESESADHERAEYRAAIYTPDKCFDYTVEMLLEGNFVLAALDDPAEESLEARLSTMARLIARDAAKKLADNLPPWPRRVLRWRGPGRG